MILLLLHIGLFSEEISVNKIALFKNGFGYFNTELQLPNSKEIKVTNIPVQTHGTFWISYPKEIKVENIFSTQSSIEEFRDFEDLFDLLKINIGEEIRVVLDLETTKSGTIFDVKDGILLLKNAQGIDVINLHTIDRFSFLSTDINRKVSFESQVTELNISLNRPYRGKKIYMDFLTRDITWVPSYIIDITDPETAIFTAKALIINEVMDLEGVDIDVITGFPGIDFAYTDSPMAKTMEMDRFFSRLSSSRTPAYAESDLMVQSVMSNRVSFDTPTPIYDEQVKVEGTEDLFFYPIKDVTLKRGDTAYKPLFTLETSYNHIYTLSVPNYLDEYGRVNNRGELDVFHSIRIKNSGNLPWTTAPAQFISGNNFTGQSTCSYTPAGSETTIKINNAVNVTVDDNESEIKRIRDADKFNGYNYDLVTLQGEIHIVNNQNKTITMEVDKTITGNSSSVSPKGDIRLLGKGIKKINPQTLITWNLDLKPMEKTVLKYSYTVYIRD